MHPGYTPAAIWLHVPPVDFRKQINGLAALLEGQLQLDAFADALYVFINRRRSSIKALYWDRNGFCLWQKRLEQDRFAWPPEHLAQPACAISARQLQWLLEGFDPWHRKSHKTLNYKLIS